MSNPKQGLVYFECALRFILPSSLCNCRPAVGSASTLLDVSSRIFLPPCSMQISFNPHVKYEEKPACSDSACKSVFVWLGLVSHVCIYSSLRNVDFSPGKAGECSLFSLSC